MIHDDVHQRARDDGRDADPATAVLHDLLSAWIDGRLDEAGAARLDHALRTSRAARDTFREWVALDVLLATMAEQTPSLGGDVDAWRTVPTGDAAASRPATPERQIPRATAGWVAAVVTVAAAGAVWLSWPSEPSPSDVAVTGGCAAVGRVVDALVEGAHMDGAAVRPGTSLGPGPIRVTRGLIQIEFFSGATLWVEGPADVEIMSAWEARLRSGRTRAHVPPPPAPVHRPAGTWD